MKRTDLASIVGFLIVLSLGRGLRAQAVVEPPPPGAPPPFAVAPPPPNEPKKPPEDPVIGKWSPKIYGFFQLDAVEDTTQSFNDSAGDAVIARPGTYAGEHGRLTLSAQHTRLGFKFHTPGEGDIHALAVIEVDFLGQYANTTTEQVVFTSPFVRMRQAWFKLETPIVDLTVGQTWQLFGWQPYFFANTVEIQGVPGMVYSRAPQIRLSHTFKGDAVNFDVAAAAARPPQRDAAVPDVQAGVKLTVNGWKGVRTLGATGTEVDALAIGVSAAIRWFKVAEFAAKPTTAVSDTGWAISADAFVPIIPGSMEDRGNSLTFTGSFATGAADADFYTGLNGGITFPALPNPTGIMPAPTYTPDIDNGLVVFNSAGELTAIKWWSTILGFQYYLPPSGRVWVAGNFSHMHSSNIADLGNPASVFKTSNWFDGNLFWDATAAVRFGFEYAWFQQIYGDDVKAKNSRFQVSGFYLF